MKKFTLILFCLISTSLVSQEKFKSLMDRYYIKDTSKGFYTRIRHDNTKIYSHDDYRTNVLRTINKIDSIRVIGVSIEEITYVYIEYNSIQGYILHDYFLDKDIIEKFQVELINDFKKNKKIRIKSDSIKTFQNNLVVKKKKIKEKKITRSKCFYDENRFDSFDKIYKKRTTYSYLETKSNSFKIQLSKIGNSKYINFFAFLDIGCTSPFETNKSYVKVKLENNQIVTFYHRGKIDCGKFGLIGLITNSDILKLKKSPIKEFRFNGTDYYMDFIEIDWNTFFIDQLKCID
jgi:hypothetical protein